MKEEDLCLSQIQNVHDAKELFLAAGGEASRRDENQYLKLFICKENLHAQ